MYTYESPIDRMRHCILHCTIYAHAVKRGLSLTYLELGVVLDDVVGDELRPNIPVLGIAHAPAPDTNIHTQDGTQPSESEMTATDNHCFSSVTTFAASIYANGCVAMGGVCLRLAVRLVLEVQREDVPLHTPSHHTNHSNQSADPPGKGTRRPAKANSASILRGP